jgi:hypothetical protein
MKISPAIRLALLFTGVVLSCHAADQVLFDFTASFDPARVRINDATAVSLPTAQGTALRLATGHRESWPGITLLAPTQRWNLAAYGEVTVRARNAGTNRATLFCRVDNPGADGTSHCLTGDLALDPGQSGTLRVTLVRTASDRLGGQLFGMRGYPVTNAAPGTLDVSNVTQLLLFVTKPTRDYTFEITDIRATGNPTLPTAWASDATPFFPFMDMFGQYRHKDWPGKVHSLAELKQRAADEAAELAARPGPTNWNRYGGWADGPQLPATGFFRAEKRDGKWWLVDPDGRLFFSHGVDCVRMLDATPMDERATWFEADQSGPELDPFWGTGYALKGHYQGRQPRTFSFAGANLLRKYGPGWQTNVPVVIHQRLRSWGLNTIANWSDEATRRLRRTAYTDALGSGDAKRIAGSEGYWGQFPDVFDESFTRGLRRSMAGKASRSANDPWCLGYFSDNEMAWGDEWSLGLAALKSPPEQAAKQAFLADLQAKYGTIEKLNTAWGTAHASWDALLQSREAPERAKAAADLTAFYTRTAEQYFRSVREAIRAVAPHQLYLGCRFAWVNDLAAAAAAKHCDVVSYNLYKRGVADFRFPGGADVPLIIGEFHFGALDRGMFHTGLVPVANQQQRAESYKEYVLGARRHPQFVGTHWFQYQDEPTTGRVYDEENYQIGFVDVADTPYRETIAAVREVGYGLY